MPSARLRHESRGGVDGARPMATDSWAPPSADWIASTERDLVEPDGLGAHSLRRRTGGSVPTLPDCAAKGSGCPADDLQPRRRLGNRYFHSPLALAKDSYLAVKRSN